MELRIREVDKGGEGNEYARGGFGGFGGLTAGKLRDQGSFSTVSLTHRTGLY